jgi:aspartate/methionine/tyrosine aminotransferase
MNALSQPDSPVYAVPEAKLLPVSDHLTNMADIPASRMFLINKGLRVFSERFPEMETYDASQGDGGASLPGVRGDILERAAQMQLARGTGYDMPYGTDAYRQSVIEQYWKLDSSSGFGPTNVVATVGGRDALVKAYQAALALGHGRQGDVLVVSRVPWISYNWGPYGVGANVLYAPGQPESGWAYNEDALRECVRYAAKSGRKVSGVVITSPDNPTGNTLSPDEKAQLARTALASGAAFVILDWMYHYVTDEQPMDLNAFLELFEPQERQHLIFMDGITKSLGGSNIRNCHLIANENVTRFIIARASHGVIPSFFSLAVAMAAYEMGYAEACRPIVEPTNASRLVLMEFLKENHFRFIQGKGYYAFIDVGDWLGRRGWPDSEPLGKYLAEEQGLAVVPGVYFSRYAANWVRFSYATPPERTLGAARRLCEGLDALG